MEQQLVHVSKGLCSIATLTLVVCFAGQGRADILTVHSFSDIEIVDEDPRTSFDLFDRLDPLIPDTNTLLHISPQFDQDNRNALIEFDMYDVGLAVPLLPPGTIINSAVFRFYVAEGTEPVGFAFGIEAFAGPGALGFSSPGLLNPDYLSLADPFLTHPDSVPGTLGFLVPHQNLWVNRSRKCNLGVGFSEGWQGKRMLSVRGM